MYCIECICDTKRKFIYQSPGQLSQKVDFGHWLIAKNKWLNHPLTFTTPVLNPGHPNLPAV